MMSASYNLSLFRFPAMVKLERRSGAHHRRHANNQLRIANKGLC